MKILIFIISFAALAQSDSVTYLTDLLNSFDKEGLLKKIEKNGEGTYRQFEDKDLYLTYMYMGNDNGEFDKAFKAAASLDVDDYKERPFIILLIYYTRLIVSRTEPTLEEIQSFAPIGSKVHFDHGDHGVSELLGQCFKLSLCQSLSFEDIVNIRYSKNQEDLTEGSSDTRGAQTIETYLRFYAKENSSFGGRKLDQSILSSSKDTWKKAFLTLSRSKWHRGSLHSNLYDSSKHYFWKLILKLIKKGIIDFNLQDYLDWWAEAEGKPVYHWNIILGSISPKYDYMRLEIPIKTYLHLARIDKERAEYDPSIGGLISSSHTNSVFRYNRFEVDYDSLSELIDLKLLPYSLSLDDMQVSFNITDEQLALFDFKKIQDIWFTKQKHEKGFYRGRGQKFRYPLCHPITLNRKIDIYKILKTAAAEFSGGERRDRLNTIISFGCSSADPDKSGYTNTHLAYRWLREEIKDEILTDRFVEQFYKKEDGYIEYAFTTSNREALKGMNFLSNLQTTLDRELAEKRKSLVLTEFAQHTHYSLGEYDTYSNEKKKGHYVLNDLETMETDSSLGLWGVDSFHHPFYDILVTEDSDKGFDFDICQKATHLKVMEGLKRAQIYEAPAKKNFGDKYLIALIGMKKHEKQLEFSVLSHRTQRVFAFLFSYDNEYCQTPTNESIDEALERIPVP